MASGAARAASSSLFVWHSYLGRVASTSVATSTRYASVRGFASRNSVTLVFREGLSHGRSSTRVQSGSTWRTASCSYSSGAEPVSVAAPIDVEAEVKTQKILVLGGNGFVGSRVSRVGIEQGFDVVSLNRSGRPGYTEPWVEQVSWVSGDAFNVKWDELLQGVTGVISCIGGFGSNEQMERINGDANIAAVEAASKAGVAKFVYVSVHRYNLPEFALNNGYFKGKRRTEEAILSKFPGNGVILQPGFIYGKRRVNGVDIPLNLIGGPLERLLDSTEKFLKPLSSIPGSDLLLAPPISVDEVAKAAIKSILDDTLFGLIDIAQIKVVAASL